MARLPTPGSDNGTWGTVLNDYLSQSHKADGTLKDGSVTSNTLASDAVNLSALNTSNTASSAQVLSYDGTNLIWTTPPTAPVTSVNSQTGAVVLTKSDVGLGNADNTSDANKPVSTATQTALNAKLTAASNLSDLASASTARTNLGLGSAATMTPATLASDVAFTGTYAPQTTSVPVFTPEAYGAVGDGTTDDSAAFSAVYTAASAAAVAAGTQATIRCRPRRYRISETIAVKPYVHLDGNGAKLVGGITGFSRIQASVPTIPASSDAAGQVAGGCFGSATATGFYGLKFSNLIIADFRFGFSSGIGTWNAPVFENIQFQFTNIGVFSYQGAQEFKLLNVTSSYGTTFVAAATCFAADNPYSGLDNFFCDGLVYDLTGSQRDGSLANANFDTWFEQAILRPDTVSVVSGGSLTWPFTGVARKVSGRNIYIPGRHQRQQFGINIRRMNTEGAALGSILIGNPCYGRFENIGGESMFADGPQSLILVLMNNGGSNQQVSEFRNINSTLVTNPARAAIEVVRATGSAYGAFVASSIDGTILGTENFRSITGNGGSDFPQYYPAAVGRWYLNPLTPSHRTSTPVQSRLCLHPFFSGPTGMTIGNVDINVTTIGASGAVTRVGIYTIDDQRNPFKWTAGTQWATLVVDGGTLATDSTTGQKIKATSTVIPPNTWFAVAGVDQGASPAIRNTGGGVASNFCPPLGGASASGGGGYGSGAPGLSLYVDSVTGALPATFTPVGSTAVDSGVGLNRTA